jgi:hypothetical protein
MPWQHIGILYRNDGRSQAAAFACRCGDTMSLALNWTTRRSSQYDTGRSVNTGSISISPLLQFIQYPIRLIVYILVREPIALQSSSSRWQCELEAVRIARKDGLPSRTQDDRYGPPSNKMIS